MADRLLLVAVRITGDTGIPDRLVIERLNTLLRANHQRLPDLFVNHRFWDGSGTFKGFDESVKPGVMEMFEDTKRMSIEPLEVLEGGLEGPRCAIVPIPRDVHVVEEAEKVEPSFGARQRIPKITLKNVGGYDPRKPLDEQRDHTLPPKKSKRRKR